MNLPFRARLAVLSLLLLVVACTRIPLSSLWSLRLFSFETFEPAALRVALRLPPEYGLRAQALRIDVKVTRGVDQSLHEAHFAMRESHDHSADGSLPAAAGEGRWWVLGFEKDEAERLRTFRAGLVPAEHEARGRGRIELSAAADLCRTGVPPSAAPKLSGAVMWSSEKGFVPLLRDDDLDDALEALKLPRDPGALPPC